MIALTETMTLTWPWAAAVLAAGVITFAVMYKTTTKG
jgi:hypothetical protein